MSAHHVQTCGEAGIKVRPRTAGGRDAMLRSAAEAAVDAAMEQSGAQLGGMPPAAFITGLAGDLGGSPLAAILDAASATCKPSHAADFLCDPPKLYHGSWSPTFWYIRYHLHAI